MIKFFDIYINSNNSFYEAFSTTNEKRCPGSSKKSLGYAALGIEPAAIGNVTVCGFNSQGANALGV